MDDSLARAARRPRRPDDDLLEHRGAAAWSATDRQSTFAVLQLTDGEDEAAIEQIRDDLTAPGLETQIGGNAVINTDINEQVSADIARAESISLPILAVMLVIIFGSFAAASLPLAIGVTAILGAFTALRGFAMVTDVSIFAVNIVTIIGLGLAIDYGLFMVSRFREEIRRQPDVETALARTMATAGRTVAVSGRHRRRLAGRPADLPAGVPALDGLRRDERRPRRDAGRADPAAGAAGDARPEGRRAVGAAVAAPGVPAPRRRTADREHRRLVPDRAQS